MGLQLRRTGKSAPGAARVPSNECGDQLNLDHEAIRHVLSDKGNIWARNIVLKLERASKESSMVSWVDAHQRLRENEFELSLASTRHMPDFKEFFRTLAYKLLSSCATPRNIGYALRISFLLAQAHDPVGHDNQAIHHSAVLAFHRPQNAPSR